MRNTISAVTIAALATVSYSALAFAAPSADEVLAANKAASGNWSGKATMKTEYAYAGQGMTGKVVSLADLSNGDWTDNAAIGPATEVNGYDGAHAWDKDPSGTVTQQDGGEQRALAVNEGYRRANMWWRADHGGAAITFAGEKTDGGNTYDVLTVVPKDGKTFDAWFDAKSHLLSRIVEMQSTQTNTTTLSNYRSFDGVQLAAKTTINNGDAKYDQTVQITNVVFLPAQEASVYAAPKNNVADYSIAGGATETTFPFKLINNHIYADVSVNGKGPYQFIFDTGGVNVVTPTTAKGLNLDLQGHLQGNGAGDGHMDFNLTKVSSLTLGNAVVKDQIFAVAPLDAMSNIEGVGMPGMVGFETFRRFVTRIDYGANTITLIRPDAFDAKDAGTPVTIAFNGNTIEAPATYDGVKGTFIIDTGSRMALSLNSPFVKAHNQFAKYESAPESVTGWGIGGKTKSRVISGAGLVLGGQTVAHPVVMLSTDTKGSDADTAQSGNIGGGILKRFVVTLDYEHNTMYLKPVTQSVADLDTYDRSGMWFNQNADGYVVVDVTSGGPSAQGGLQVNDEIVAVDGKPASATPVYAMRERLRDEKAGTVVTFTVKRAGATQDVKVTLRDLI